MSLAMLLAVGYQAAVTLRYAPPVGTIVRYRMTTSMRQTVTSTQPVPEITFRQEFNQRLKVLGRKNGRTTVDSLIEKVKVILPPGSPLAASKQAIENGLTGLASTNVLDVRGQLVSSRVRGGQKGNPISAQAQSAAQGAAGAMGSIQLPDRPIKIGESWSFEMDLGKFANGMAASSGFKAAGKMPMTMNLVRMEGDLAVITFTMSGTLTMSQARAQVSSRTLGSGTTRVNVKTGLTDSAFVTTTTTTKIVGAEFTQKMTQTMRRI